MAVLKCLEHFESYKLRHRMRHAFYTVPEGISFNKFISAYVIAIRREK